MRPEQHEEFARHMAGVSDPSPPESPNPPASEAGPVRSLLSDIEALIDDAQTWFDAEIGYQKSRVGFLANRAKSLVVLFAGALIFGVMALFALVVGLLLALTPLITAWGATAVVVGALLIGAFLMVRKASGVWHTAQGALDESGSKADV